MNLKQFSSQTILLYAVKIKVILYISNKYSYSIGLAVSKLLRKLGFLVSMRHEVKLGFSLLVQINRFLCLYGFERYVVLIYARRE